MVRFHQEAPGVQTMALVIHYHGEESRDTQPELV